MIKVKSATSNGYEEATVGDSINLSNPNSETRRGRVGSQRAQTLETSCNQAVVEPMIGIGIYGNNKQSQYQKEVTRALALKASNQTNPRSGGTTLVGNQYRIRRLTPIECERLQGFPDQHTAFGNYDGETKPMSNTQRYKQCGNAVTVDVVEAVAKKCIPLF